MLNNELKDKIALQSLNEITFNRNYKQGKISNWQKNEQMYYQKKTVGVENRANVNLGRAQEFVHTLLSKIDNPLVFKFTKRKLSQLKRVELLNSLRMIDAQTDSWDIKDLVGKKQGIIYGRAVYSYYADNINGYQAHLEPVDIYNFLIDPTTGGVDIGLASNMGRYGIVKTKTELEQGIENNLYDEQQTDNLINGVGNVTEQSQEINNQLLRTRATEVIGTKEHSQEANQKWRFWEWYTTYEGVKYYALMTNSGDWIRIEPLKDIFKSDMFPFWSWAAFPDLTEFWTPSYLDYVREIFMAQDVSINQMLDNAEAINKPMKIVNVGAIEDLSRLKYRRDGLIPTRGDYDANRAVQVIQTPSINTPIAVFNILEAIQEKASGVTSGAKGVSDEHGRVGIYEGNQASAADRFGLLNKSYSFGYRRFAKLYECGVRENLIKRVAVDILGVNGVEIANINRNDLFKKGDNYNILVDTSNADVLTSIQDQRTKISFLSGQINNPAVNQKKIFELQAKIAGFNEDDIKELLDINAFGNEELLSEAERDIELLLNNDDIKPNKNANNAYKQRIVDYLNDHEEDISIEQFNRITNYIISIEQLIIRNMARQLQISQANQLAAQPQMQPPTAAPINNQPVELETNL